jgi:hypothetical protein
MRVWGRAHLRQNSPFEMNEVLPQRPPMVGGLCFVFCSILAPENLLDARFCVVSSVAVGRPQPDTE